MQVSGTLATRTQGQDSAFPQRLQTSMTACRSPSHSLLLPCGPLSPSAAGHSPKGMLSCACSRGYAPANALSLCPAGVAGHAARAGHVLNGCNLVWLTVQATLVLLLIVGAGVVGHRCSAGLVLAGCSPLCFTVQAILRGLLIVGSGAAGHRRRAGLVLAGCSSKGP